MIWSSFFAFLHFVAAIGVVVMVIYERITFGSEISLQDAKRIQRADALYGLCSMLVVAIGFLRVFYFEKGSNFYFSNTFFWVKLGVFSIVGLLSIYPTIRFIKWRKFTKKGLQPEISASEFVKIQRLMNLEIIGLVIILISASLMAKGIGF